MFSLTVSGAALRMEADIVWLLRGSNIAKMSRSLSMIALSIGCGQSAVFVQPLR